MKVCFFTFSSRAERTHCRGPPSRWGAPQNPGGTQSLLATRPAPLYGPAAMLAARGSGGTDPAKMEARSLQGV